MRQLRLREEWDFIKFPESGASLSLPSLPLPSNSKDPLPIVESERTKQPVQLQELKTEKSSLSQSPFCFLQGCEEVILSLRNPHLFLSSLPGKRLLTRQAPSDVFCPFFQGTQGALNRRRCS